MEVARHEPRHIELSGYSRGRLGRPRRFATNSVELRSTPSLESQLLPRALRIGVRFLRWKVYKGHISLLAIFERRPLRRCRLAIVSQCTILAFS